MARKPGLNTFIAPVLEDYTACWIADPDRGTLVEMGNIFLLMGNIIHEIDP
jgi:hypothetical protein